MHQCIQRKGSLPQCKIDVSELIILAVSYRYSLRGVVWCVAAKVVESMRKTLEDFYYGNIVPYERQMAPNSELKRAADRVTRYESQLTQQLDEAERTILEKLIRSQDDINSITALENFILGFRLGVRMMAECMDGNDDDIREVTDYG